MDSFVDALLSGKTDRIPDEYDWFAPLIGDWDCAMKRLCFTKQGGKLVGKVLSEENAFWIFSDITADSFHWENVRMKDNGERFLVCEIFGKRIR